MPEAAGIGLPQYVISENFKLDGRRSAKLVQEFRDQRSTLPAERARQEPKRLLIAAGLETIELRFQVGHRFFPGDFLELIGATLAGSLQGMRNAIGMIRELD